MGRAASSKTKILCVVIIIIAIGLGSWAYVAKSPAQNSQLGNSVPSSVVRPQVTQISYQGKNSVDALTLLKQHANVKTKHYSFGDEVISINGVTNGGGKYWTFYVNGHMSDVGASSYKTKNSDRLMWRLEK